MTETNKLIELGKLDLNQRHGSSILLRYTHDLRPVYQILRCSLPATNHGTLVSCARPVIGVLGPHAFCEHHSESPDRNRLFYNQGMNHIYGALRCSIPEHYEDCTNHVIGSYKDTAFCKQHAYYAMDRRRSYPFQVDG